MAKESGRDGGGGRLSSILKVLLKSINKYGMRFCNMEETSMEIQKPFSTLEMLVPFVGPLLGTYKGVKDILKDIEEVKR